MIETHLIAEAIARTRLLEDLIPASDPGPHPLAIEDALALQSLVSRLKEEVFKLRGYKEEPVTGHWPHNTELGIIDLSIEWENHMYHEEGRNFTAQLPVGKRRLEIINHTQGESTRLTEVRFIGAQKIVTFRPSEAA